MESSTNCGINSLPTELLQLIHSFLPPEDQFLTIPKVSQIWHSISEESKKFKELEKSFLERSIEKHGYNHDKTNTIINLYKTNNFISYIKENNFKCEGNYSCNEAKMVKKNLTFSGKRKDGYSVPFHINWNPNTLRLSTTKGKWGDFRTSFSIRIGVLELSYQRKNLFKSFKLGAYPFNGYERRGLISWKRDSKKKRLNLKK